MELRYLGPLPARVTDKTWWQCKNCGKRRFKTYRALCLRPNGCRCGSATTLSKNKYLEAAARFGITFVPTSGLLPPNTKTKTQWVGPSGDTVNATYHEIAYKMSKRTQQLLGLVTAPAPAAAPRKRKGRKPSELRGLPPQPKGRAKEKENELATQGLELDSVTVSPRFA